RARVDGAGRVAGAAGAARDAVREKRDGGPEPAGPGARQRHDGGGAAPRDTRGGTQARVRQNRYGREEARPRPPARGVNRAGQILRMRGIVARTTPNAITCSVPTTAKTLPYVKPASSSRPAATFMSRPPIAP